MLRWFLVCWLAAFAGQSTDVFALIAPDACSEELSGTAGDPCQDACTRCLCCARAPVFAPYAPPPMGSDRGARPTAPPRVDPSITATPRGVFHVPKPTLS